MPDYPELSEAERFPRLTVRGRALLHGMRQHPQAPLWNWPNGEQLNDEGLARVQAFAESLAKHHAESETTYLKRQRQGSQTACEGLNAAMTEPEWLSNFVDRCLHEVPYHRQRVRPGTPFLQIPTCGREDLAPRVWAFVPDSEPLDALISFSSSGTTGYPVRTPHHPYSAACGVPLMEHALRSLHQIEFLRGPERVSLCNVAAYPGAYTTAIVVSYLEEAGCIRVNLDPSAWRAERDRESYINAWKAPIWLGDPIAFGSLQSLDIDHQPRAILSSIMHLSTTFAQQLASKYACPVLDLYAMTEAGIIACGTDAGHRVLAPDLFVEILDEQEQRCPEGERGEIVLTGGRNPYMPLLRYRTGDYAALKMVNGHRTLIGLEGREPVEYPIPSGRIVHSMEITRLMRRYPVFHYEMKVLEGDYHLLVRGDVDWKSLRGELESLFEGQVKVIDASSQH